MMVNVLTAILKNDEWLSSPFAKRMSISCISWWTTTSSAWQTFWTWGDRLKWRWLPSGRKCWRIHLSVSWVPRQHSSATIQSLVTSVRGLLISMCTHLLTSKYIQWIQIIPTNDRAPSEKKRPAFLKALGKTNIPVPMLPFMRWITVSTFLFQIKNWNSVQNSSPCD